jgi:calicheamicin 3'-O-methyl-rhamnosyltransferase
VYVTLGTRLIEPRLLRLVVESLLDLDVNVICTTGADDNLAAVPNPSERLHVERFIPQSAVLPHCDLVVCHAGSGTMLGALSHGLPMLLLPHAADQFDNADLSVNRGVGIRLLAGEVSAGAVASATRHLLSDPRYAHAAAEVRDQLRALPGPETAVERCEVLVSSCRLSMVRRGRPDGGLSKMCLD